MTSPRAMAGLAAIGLCLSGGLYLRAGGALDAGSTADARSTVGSRLEPPTGFRPEAYELPDENLLGFVEIPGGPFTMGSDKELDPAAFDIEAWGPAGGQGVIDLPSFYIGRYEVTVAQFAVFVDESGHVADPDSGSGPATHPVVSVAWTDALAYARWLDSELRRPESPEGVLRALLQAGWHVSLPTEAQWEKAARGTDGRIYPWGTELRTDRANFNASGTIPVGSIDCPECAHGLSDMAGNVWEWTLSPYQPYPYSEEDDRDGLEADALWVMRGGSFEDGGQNIRTANRGGADPGARRAFIGFRVVISR